MSLGLCLLQVLLKVLLRVRAHLDGRARLHEVLGEQLPVVAVLAQTVEELRVLLVRPATERACEGKMEREGKRDKRVRMGREAVSMVTSKLQLLLLYSVTVAIECA